MSLIFFVPCLFSLFSLENDYRYVRHPVGISLFLNKQSSDRFFFKQLGTVYRYVCQNFLILKTAAGTATGWGISLFLNKQSVYHLFF